MGTRKCRVKDGDRRHPKTVKSLPKQFVRLTLAFCCLVVAAVEGQEVRRAIPVNPPEFETPAPVLTPEIPARPAVSAPAPPASLTPAPNVPAMPPGVRNR